MMSSSKGKPLLSFAISNILNLRNTRTDDVVSEQEASRKSLTADANESSTTAEEYPMTQDLTEESSDSADFISTSTKLSSNRSSREHETRNTAVVSTASGLTACNMLIKPIDRFQSKPFGEFRRVGHPYSNRTPPKRKKPRTTFSREQIAELESRFLGQKYLASTERLRLAKNLQLSDSQVKTWFQNRRTKWRRQTNEEREAERNAATKYIMKIQQNAATVAAGAAFWSPLLAASVPLNSITTSSVLNTLKSINF